MSTSAVRRRRPLPTASPALDLARSAGYYAHDMLEARLPLAIDTRRLRSLDGTEIAYHLTCSSQTGAPWIVLAGGLGGTLPIFRGLVDYFRDRYRFATWDYRGLHGSEPPFSNAPGGYDVAHHARDLEALLAAEHIDRFGLVGWSTGVQVILEATSSLRGKAHSLVLAGGTGGRPLDPLAPLSTARTAIRPLIDLFRRARALGPGAHRPIGRRDAAAWLDRLDLVGRSADPSTADAIISSIAQLDRDAFLRNLTAFADHDARDRLPAIDLPVLLVAGDRDPLVPRGVAQQMARTLPHAELLLIRGGAHFTPAEYPELVALRIERFYREHALP